MTKTRVNCQPLNLLMQALQKQVDRFSQQSTKTKKTMSSKVFRYIMEANDEQLQQMKLAVDSSVHKYWQAKLMSDASVKLDDVGDALLHALDELLCGSIGLISTSTPASRSTLYHTRACRPTVGITLTSLSRPLSRCCPCNKPVLQVRGTHDVALVCVRRNPQQTSTCVPSVTYNYWDGTSPRQQCDRARCVRHLLPTRPHE